MTLASGADDVSSLACAVISGLAAFILIMVVFKRHYRLVASLDVTARSLGVFLFIVFIGLFILQTVTGIPVFEHLANIADD